MARADTHKRKNHATFEYSDAADAFRRSHLRLHYWTFARFFVSTPDAYVQADSAGGRVEMPDPSPDAKSGQEHKSYDKHSHAIATD